MDELIEETGSAGETTWTKEVKLDDGGYIRTKVEEVSNGFLKCVDKNTKEGDKWTFETVKSIHSDNPLKEKSLVEKLAEALKE
ncbi:MAG: hypothetical protein GOVbin3661_83 [Prokaryotic dsDNA virus sp.]|jgi:hypothetical protein|nr:MAG: hypothetical protein GOVbin3661_83 [Prokaryotic dsDNA virus sp.]|tara:strand:- start:141 stop:389 length:249 start_codon:yes stop_codon:yes gene_type:complete